MATGDLQASLDRVRRLLRAVRCPVEADLPGLCRGDCRSLLPLLGYALTSYSKPLAAALADSGLEVSSSCRALTVR